MLDAEAMALFAGAMLLSTAPPGPIVAAIAARVLSAGLRPVIPFLVALWIGETVWLTCAVLGLAAVAQTWAGALVALRWAGVAYLLWLAWSMWRAPVETGPGAAALPRARGWRLFAAGFGLALGSPENAVFYLALLPNVVTFGAVGLVGWAQLTACMLTVLIVCDLTWSLAAHRARRLFATPRGRRLANRVGAGALGGAAAAMAAA